jgi:hypothetical protein
MLSRAIGFSSLKRWELATVLQRMWLDGADFRWGREVSATA